MTTTSAPAPATTLEPIAAALVEAMGQLREHDFISIEVERGKVAICEPAARGTFTFNTTIEQLPQAISAAASRTITNLMPGGMCIYIAGPMTGLPELNFPAFHQAAEWLRSNGHRAINPAELNPDTNAKLDECMRTDISALVRCDAIALLPGWEKSKGATLECHIATTLGMQRIYLGDSLTVSRVEKAAA